MDEWRNGLKYGPSNKKKLNKSIAFACSDGVTKTMRRFLDFEELTCVNYWMFFLDFCDSSKKCSDKCSCFGKYLADLNPLSDPSTDLSAYGNTMYICARVSTRKIRRRKREDEHKRNAKLTIVRWCSKQVILTDVKMPLDPFDVASMCPRASRSRHQHPHHCF